jgi:KDO2-lipid IV(A) lauroyltransferase
MGLMLMWSIVQLPYSLQLKMGRALGIASYYFARSRRHICAVNLKLCFPELSALEHRRLVKKTFISNGIGLIETAMAWFGDPETYRPMIKVSGLENLDLALSQGKGVLLVCPHFSTLDFGGLMTSLYQRMDVTYRPNKNPLFDAVMMNGRRRLYNQVLDRKNVRGAMRSLKSGHILWYAPDQDYGARHSVFVPFFNNQAATITATSRFARANDSPVIFCSHYRNEDDSGYHLYFSKPLENYPSEDEEADAATINRMVEAAIRKQPDQYMWLHKRFKTQAAGKAARPY